ncbi:MAG: hypothetical protein RI948_307 [Bacteroidota bacterium]|jgi:hypothetical protein
MEFVHPERLWFLFLLLIPIVIHLFHFRKRKTLYFSSLRFIQFLEKEQQSTRKLKHLLVLLTRILALSAVVFAFAQPQRRNDAAQQAGKPALLIYLDNSFSMSAIGTEGSLFSEGRELAKRMLQEVKPDTRVLICSNQLNHAEQRFESKAEALRYLDKLEIYALSRSLDDVLTWQQKQIERHQLQKEKLGQIQQVIISDFQLSQAKLSAQKPQANQSFYAYQLKAQQNQNAYIDSIWFAKPTQQRQTEQTLMVRVQNYGEQAKKRLELQVKIGKIKRTMFMQIGANNSQIASFPYTETNKGFVQGQVQINDQQIHFDDTWYFSYEIPERTNIYLIEEADASPNVARAYAVEARYNVQKTSPGEVAANTLSKADLIVLNGLNEISSGLLDELSTAHQNGQRILIIPGENIRLNDYKPLLQALSLPELGAVQSNALNLQRINDEDPFFKGVFEKKQERLNVPLVKKAYGLLNQGQSSATPLLISRSGQALFMRANNSAFLFTTALQSSFGSLVNQSLFPTILLRCGEYASERFPAYAILGKDAQIKVRAQHQEEAPLRFISDQTEFIAQYIASPNQLRIQIGGSAALEKLKAGIYTLKGSEVLAQLALNNNRTESKLELLDQSTLLDLLETNGVKNCTFNQIKEGQSLTAIQLDETKSYWRYFLVFGLLCLLAELSLLKWWK